MPKFTLVALTLLAALGARATTLSDNLTASTFATELISGLTWITAGFQTGSLSYLLNSATFLMSRIHRELSMLDYILMQRCSPPTI